MNSLKKERIGRYIDVLTDYHSNGSYESLKKNVTLLEQKDHAIMIRTLNFERDDFINNLIYVDECAYEHLSKSKVYPNDILTNKIANPGSIYIMPDLGCPVTCGMNLFLIRYNSEVNQRYMYYCMKNAEAYIKSLAHGTTTKTITKDDVRNIELLMHVDISDQNRVEKILTTIDRVISLNKEICRVAEDFASVAYMHLFFGKKPNGTIADILIENEKSTIKVGDAKKGSGDIPFFTSGDAILSWNIPLINGRNLYLNTGGNAGVKFFVGETAYSTDTWCITAKDDMQDYLYLLLHCIRKEIDAKYFHGTGLKHLQKQALKAKSIYIPSEEELKSFNDYIQPMFTLVSKAYLENQKLSKLRDWLLPMLMNGQAVVSD